MKGLLPSSKAWVDAALSDVSTLLIDHAHCERKAAWTALRLIAHHGDRVKMVTQLSRLAREELVHFERVIAELGRRGLSYAPLPAAGYAAELLKLVRQRTRLLDELLVCAIIEARSHERFERLIASATDGELVAMYRDLAEAEARHEGLYLTLAAEESGADAATIEARLSELLSAEAEILQRPNQPVRMHAGG